MIAISLPVRWVLAKKRPWVFFSLSFRKSGQKKAWFKPFFQRDFITSLDSAILGRSIDWNIAQKSAHFQSFSVRFNYIFSCGIWIERHTYVRDRLLFLDGKNLCCSFLAAVSSRVRSVPHHGGGGSGAGGVFRTPGPALGASPALRSSRTATASSSSASSPHRSNIVTRYREIKHKYLNSVFVWADTIILAYVFF